MSVIMKASFSKEELIATLRQSGLNEGQTAVVFASLFDLGLPACQGVNLARFYLDALFEIVGESGVVAIPAFTYTCGQGVSFQPYTDKSTVNVLANYCIDHHIGCRSVHPVFSYILLTAYDLRCLDARKHHSPCPELPEESQYSKLRELSFSNVCLDSNEHSIAGYLLAHNARYIMLGNICFFTFFHCIEQQLKSPNRFFKRFRVKIVDNIHAPDSPDNKSIDPYDAYYFVRYLCPNTEWRVFMDCFERCQTMAQERHEPTLFNHYALGKGLIWSGDLNFMWQCFLLFLQENISIGCVGPTLTPEQTAHYRDPFATAPQDLQRHYYQVWDLHQAATNTN